MGFVEFKIETGVRAQTYKIGETDPGTTSFIRVDAKRVNSDAENDIIALTAGAGASGCAEVVSIVSINQEGLTFSPNLNACGGVKRGVGFGEWRPLE